MLAEVLLAILVLIATALAVRARRQGARTGRRPLSTTPSGARRLYSRRGFLKLGGAIVGAGALAYSGADEAIDEWQSEHMVNGTTEVLSKQVKQFGERYWFFVWLGFAAVDSFFASTRLTRWGRRNLQAMVIGLPTLWGTQYALGAARPSDNTHGPRFRPLADHNSSSGHTFIAAIPLLNAAREFGHPVGRGSLQFASWMTGWSRIHDRKHYLSQVLLGWGIAHEAVAAVAIDAEAQRTVSRPSTQAGGGVD